MKIRQSVKLSRKKGVRPGQSSSSNPTATKHRDAARKIRTSSKKLMLKEPSVMGRPENDERLRPTSLTVTPAGVFIGLKPQLLPIQQFINASLESVGDVLRERLPDDLSDSFCAYFAALLPLLGSVHELALSLRKHGSEAERTKFVFQAAGVVYPFSVVARRVPEAIVYQHWQQLIKIVHELLPVVETIAKSVESIDSDSDEDAENENPGERNAEVVAGILLLRSLLVLISRLVLIRASACATSMKAEPEDWRPPNGVTASLFATLFHFAFHSKPRVRHLAHEAIVRIVSQPNIFQSKVITKQTSDLLLTLVKRSSNGAESNEVMIRRCLSLVRDVAPFLPATNLKGLAELILTFTLMGSHTVKFLAYGSLASCCANQADASESEQGICLAESLAAALMSDFKPPSFTTTAPVPQLLVPVYSGWLRCLQVAHMAVLKHNPVKALVALPAFVEVVFKLFFAATSATAAKETNSGAAGENQKLVDLTIGLLQTWIGVLAELCRKNKDRISDLTAVDGAVKALMKMLESALGYEHQDSWSQILHFIANVIIQFGGTVNDVVALAQRMLPDLAELQLNASNRIASGAERNVLQLMSAIDDVFGASIAAFGPQFVTDLVPLLKLSEETLTCLRKADIDSTSWMLSLLGKYAGNSASGEEAGSRIEYFTNHLLPLATSVENAMARANQVNNNEAAAALALLNTRIWSTLPSFCVTSSSNFPILLTPDFAKLLGDRLANHPVTRPFIINALRRIIENAPKQLSRYAKNFLPIFFNVHISQADKKGSATEDDGLILSTVTLWYSQSEAISVELAQQFIERTWSRLSEALGTLKTSRLSEGNAESREKIERLPPLLLDLCIAMLVRFSPDYVRLFLTKTHRAVVVDLLTSAHNPSLQKRAYRLIEESLEIVVIRVSDKEGCLSKEQQFHFVRYEVHNMLADVLPKTAAPSRRDRLSCLLSFAKAALITATEEHNNLDFQSVVLWEAVASLVDVNARARVAAQKLLVFIASVMVSPQTALALCFGQKKFSDNTADTDDESIHCRLETLLRLLLDHLPTTSQLAANKQQSMIEKCCAILCALGKLFRHFRNPLIHEHIDVFLDRMEPILSNCQLVSHRRVVRACLQALSNAISALPVSELECLLSRIVPIISGISLPDSHRKTLRTVFERVSSKLCRKCGVVIVTSLMMNLRNSNDKRLRHLIRTLKRNCTAKLRDKRDESSYEESDVDEEDNVTVNKPQRRYKQAPTDSKLRLIENVDEIADAVEPSSALKNATRQHELMVAMSRKRNNQSDMDSKPIVVRDRNNRSSRMEDDSDGIVSDNDDFDDAELEAGSNRKKMKQESKRKAQLHGKRPPKQKNIAKSNPSTKKGRGMQPFSYQPFQRKLLNRRLSARK